MLEFHLWDTGCNVQLVVRASGLGTVAGTRISSQCRDASTMNYMLSV